MESADADRQAEMPITAPDGNRRNRRDYGDGASRSTARTDNSYPQTMQMIEAVVERENMIKKTWSRLAAKSIAASAM